MPGHYERLSPLDASFLALESATTHMHVAGIAVFDAEPLVQDDGGIDVDRIRQYVASRLDLIPRYRQRLARVPVERHPVWVDDEFFNLEYHVRHTSLPRPGSMAQLEELTARLVSRALDRAKPLWEFIVVEGLEGNRFAVVSKIHHCMIDGIAGVDLMAVMLNLAPHSDVEEPKPFHPRPEPSGAELAVRETARRVGRVVSTMRSARRMVDDAQTVAFEGARRVRAMRHSLGSGWLSNAPRTPLNGKVSPNRRFMVLDTDLGAVKEIKNALGGSVNDVVLATVAGGVRSFLEQRQVATNIPFRVMAPVSVRTADQRGSMGNHVAMWLVRLPIDEADPVRRLELVAEETLKLKQTDQALGASTLVQLSVGAPATLLSLASRLASGARPFNMTVTNVPGPQFPLYLLESRMVASYPLVPLWESHGVGIALFSYAGSVGWGFNGDWDLMPDLDEFVAAVDTAFAELLAAARRGGGAVTTSPAKVPKKRPPLGTPSAAVGTTTPPTRKPSSEESAPKKAAPKKSGTKKASAKESSAKKATSKKKSSGKKATSAKKDVSKAGKKST